MSNQDAAERQALAEGLGQALAQAEQDLGQRAAQQPDQPIGDPQMPLQRTLERLANEENPDERRRLAQLLGQQIVRADGRSIDQMQAALWAQQIDIRQWVGDTNSMFADLLQSMRTLAAGMERIETEQRTQGDTQGMMAGHLSALTERIDRQLGDHEQRLGRAEHKLGDHEQRLATLERAIRQSHGPAQS